MIAHLLIVAHVDPDELHYPTKQERETWAHERPGVDHRVASPRLLGLFETREAAERYVLEAQAAGDPDYFGDGCFAVVPVETFTTATEIAPGWTD